MPAHQKIPDKERLTDYASKNLTYKEMADRWERESGVRVVPTAFGNALNRLGLNHGRKQYNELIPWQPIWSGHNMAYHLQRLRWLGARRRGKTLDTGVARRLDKWLAEMAEAGEVAITYDYESEDGFYVVPRRDGDVDMGDGIWLRPPKAD